MVKSVAEADTREQAQQQEIKQSTARRYSAAKTVADLLIERLIAWGVDTVFGFPGDGINGIFESLRTRQDRLKFIQVRLVGQGRSPG